MTLYFFSKQKLYIPLIAVLFLLTVQSASAQMFSVQGDSPSQVIPTPSTKLYLGWEPAKFDYTGDTSIAEAGIFEFDGSLLRLKFETGGLEAYVGVGGKMTGLDGITYFDTGIRVIQALRLVREPNFQILIPLQLKSSLTSVGTDQLLGGNDQFQQGTIELGGGAQINVRFNERTRFVAGAVPNYGFSFATGSTFGGKIFELETRARLFIDRLLYNQIGVSVGWDYGFKQFNIDRDAYDYNLTSHSLLVGITF